MNEINKALEALRRAMVCSSVNDVFSAVGEAMDHLSSAAASQPAPVEDRLCDEEDCAKCYPRAAQVEAQAVVVPEWHKALAAAEGGNLLARFIEDNEPAEDAREWRESVRDMLQQVSGRPAVLEEDIDAALSASNQNGGE